MWGSVLEVCRFRPMRTQLEDNGQRRLLLRLTNRFFICTKTLGADITAIWVSWSAALRSSSASILAVSSAYWTSYQHLPFTVNMPFRKYSPNPSLKL